MSRFSRFSIAAFAALAALVGVLTFSAGNTKVEAYSDLRVAVACNPLTSSQLAKPGDTQLCRIKVSNYGTVPITDVTVSRPTPNTITARYGYRAWMGLNCDLDGCDPFTLPARTSYIIMEESTFNPYQDGRGNTTATATGLQAGYPVSATGTEQKSLP